MVSTTAHALCCLAVAAAYTLPTKIAAPRWRRTTARRAVDLSPFEEEVIRSADDQYPLTLDNVEMIVDELRPYLMSDGGISWRQRPSGSSRARNRSPRHRAGIASMAWRTTRRSSHE